MKPALPLCEAPSAGDKLISPRLKGELGGRPERACATTERQAHCIRQQCRFGLNGRGRIDRQIETGRLDRQQFEGRIKDNSVVAATRKGAEREDAASAVTEVQPTHGHALGPNLPE